MRFTRGADVVTATLQDGDWALEGDTSIYADMSSASELPYVEFLCPWKISNKSGSLRSLLAVSLAVGAELDESTASTEAVRERNWLINGGSHTPTSDDEDISY